LLLGILSNKWGYFTHIERGGFVEKIKKIKFVFILK
jgi:hypothetical protein